jgi:xanthine/uracil permease
VVALLRVFACPPAQKQGLTFDEAFGKILGTVAVCAVWPVILSFMPHKALKKVFPPIVTGITIFLIGTKLVATGFKVGGVQHYSCLSSTPPACSDALLTGLCG